MATLMTEQEQKKVNSYKIEHKMNFEREQFHLESQAERKGEAFTPAEYVEPNDEEILALVRAGWKSGLDRAFEKKFARESTQRIPGGLFFKK